MNKRFLHLIQLFVLGLDLLSLNCLFLFSWLWTDGISDHFNTEYNRFWIWLNMTWLLVGWMSTLYHERRIISFEAFCRRTMHTFFIWVGVVLVYLFFAQQYELSRFFILVVLCSYGCLLLVNRFLYLAVFYYYKQKHFFSGKVLIIGYNEVAKKLATYLKEDGMNRHIIGFCEEEGKIKELSHYPIVAPVDKTMEAVQLHGVNEIYSTIAPEQNNAIYQLMKQADQACVRFRLIPDLSFFINGAFHIDYIKDIPVLSVRKEQLLDDHGLQMRKRAFDVVVSLLVIILILSWLVPLLALLIWIESPGPVFFTQKRSGKNNKPFTCFKFRSMKINREANSKQATRNDSRITRVGKFMRKTNLDEFPQFFNVLLGEMSIVGPRPHMLKHTDDYSKKIDQYMIRQFLKPGITGWAQVNGYRGETTTLEQMEGRVMHDLWYLENWGLWLDLRIVFLTIYTTIRGDHNAF